MYLAEISPTAVRSAVGTAHQLGITIGCLMAFALSTPSLHLLGGSDTWRYAFLVPPACSLVQCAVLPFCPESPAFIYRTVGSSAALRKLAELHDSTSIGGHIDALRNEHDGHILGGAVDSGFTIMVCADPLHVRPPAAIRSPPGPPAAPTLSRDPQPQPSAPARARWACRSCSARANCAATCSSAW